MPEPVPPRDPSERKADFGSIYDRADPTSYFTSLRPLRYRTPDVAAPIFRRCLAALTRQRGLARATVLDLCCGYGANAMLVNHRMTMEELYNRFSARRLTRPVEQRIREDAEWFATWRRPVPAGQSARPRFVGIDPAGHALNYARTTGLLATTIEADLENAPPAQDAAASIAPAVLVTVTGGMSYIGPKTFARVLAAGSGGRRPWIATFPLRHIDVRPLAALLKRHGYVVEPWTQYGFAHRRFADRDERTRLTAATQVAIDDGADPLTWHDDRPPARDEIEAVFWLARPEDEADEVPLATLVEGDGPVHEAAKAAYLGVR